MATSLRVWAGTLESDPPNDPTAGVRAALTITMSASFILSSRLELALGHTAVHCNWKDKQAGRVKSIAKVAGTAYTERGSYPRKCGTGPAVGGSARPRGQGSRGAGAEEKWTRG